MFIFGNSTPQAKQQPAYTGLQIQTSAYGKVLTLAYGTVRLAPNLIWYGNFKSIAHKSSAGSGGKGGGSVPGSVTYTYSASFQMALCEGPIVDVSKVYIDKTVKSISAAGFTIFKGTYPQDPWDFSDSSATETESHTVPGSPYHVQSNLTFVSDVSVTLAGPFAMTESNDPQVNEFELFPSSNPSCLFNAANAGHSVVITIDGGVTINATIPSSAPYNIFLPAQSVSTATVSLLDMNFVPVASSPGVNQYSVSNTGLYTFNAANTGAVVTLTYHPSVVTGGFQALGYNGIAHADVASYDLGSNPSLSNHNFEVEAQYSNSVSGKQDADPSLVIADYLSNPHYGAGYPASRIGDLTNYQNYCLAAGLLLSFNLSDQQQASSTLEDIATATNSAFVESEGLLKLVPYGDEALTGNGKTYTPPAAPEYDLTDDDFIAADGDDPVQLVRKRPSDANNSIQLEFDDRANDYNKAIVEAKDQAAIDLYGLRQKSATSTHLFADAAAAKISVQLQLQREAIRNVYTVTTDQRYILLDPMDIVTLTDPVIGLNRQWVRILEIEEEDDKNLTFTVEEYLGGTGAAAEYSFETGGGYSADYNADPGNANPPVIFSAPVQIATANGLEVWIAVSGGPLWGGCDVYVSTDNDTYKLAGRLTGPCRMGSLSTSLPSGSDPDTMNTLSVDLRPSRGELLSGTKDDADLGHTLCFVDGELIAYQTATLTDINRYDLTYLRRGMYGTDIEAHGAGGQFARLDGGVLVYPYDKSQIGQQIFVKLASFNLYGAGAQGLADINPYVYTITGPAPPANVEGFLVLQNGNSVVFQWNEVLDYALKGYDIAYAPQGEASWGNFVLLTEALRGTEMTNASVPAGTWTFGIRAKDIADQLSPDIATFDLVVVNNDDTTTQQQQEPDWNGTLHNFVRHWTGVLIPESTQLASHYTDYTLFDNFVPDPVAEAYYITPTYDIGFINDLRIHYNAALTLGPGETGSPTTRAQLDSWTTGSDPGVYVDWSVGNIPVRYLNMKIIYDPSAGNVGFLSDFTYAVDRSPTIEQAQSETIAPGGTTITFPEPFHQVPYVTATPISGSALFPTVDNITTDNCVIHVWDSSGTDVGGTVNWKAEGI